MSQKIHHYLLLLFGAIFLLSLYLLNGTGDAGDSILHYLYAKKTPIHPELFFNHWAKPLYVLLASPFAQFGFIGVKVFNSIVSLATLYFTFKTAKALGLKNSYASMFFLMFSPLFFSLTLSGLTEPLFALILILSIYFSTQKHFVRAAIFISFLPFVRTEGLILIGVFATYFLIKKEWKAILCLPLGHLIYAIAGYPIYKDLMWVFNRNPYATLDGFYGSGKLFHFVEQLLYVVGVPIYILFIFGLIAVIWNSVYKKLSSEFVVLIFLGFGAFFVAHSLFWYLGIFNSMGLKRVLIAVLPLVAIISLLGYNFVLDTLLRKNEKIQKGLKIGLLAYVIIFPFTSNPAALKIKKDLMLTNDQVLAQKIAAIVEDSLLSDHRFLYAHPYLSETLNIDYFDPTKRIDLNKKTISSDLVQGDLIIWENWFAVVEGKVIQKDLDQMSELEKIIEIENTDSGYHAKYIIYQKK